MSLPRGMIGVCFFILMSLFSLKGNTAGLNEIMIRGSVHSFDEKSLTLWTLSGKVKVPRNKNLSPKIGEKISVYTDLQTVMKLNNIDI